METDSQVYDEQAAAEIARLKANPKEYLSKSWEEIHSLHQRAFSPPAEAAPQPTDTTGKPTEEPAEQPPEEPEPSAASRSVPDFAALIMETGVPEARRGEAEARLRHAWFKMPENREVRPVLERFEDLEISQADQHRYLGEYFRAAVRTTPTDPKASEAALRKQWGGSYSAKLADANLAVFLLGLTPRLAREGDIFDDARVIRPLAEVGAKLRPHSEAYAKRRDDPNEAANLPGHPEHETAREQLEQLRRKVYGRRG